MQHHKSYRSKMIASSAIVFAFAAGAVAEAQGSEEASSRSNEVVVLGTVTVSAQRRDQDVVEVPISLTQFDGETIELLRTTELTEYFQYTPNVSFASRGDRFNPRTSVRGVQTLGGRAPALGVYQDGFNVSPTISNVTANQTLVDVERIEVLRGPQGTTFGRNALAGALNVVTVKPDAEFFASGTVDVASVHGGSYETLVRGTINGALADNLFIRASAGYEYEDGWVNNVAPEGETNDLTDKGARIALRWVPSSQITVDASVLYQEAEQNRLNLIPTGILPAGSIPAGLAATGFSAVPIPVAPGTAGFVSDGNTDTVAFNVPNVRTVETLIALARVEYEAGDFTFISTTGYLDNESTLRDDVDASALDILRTESPVLNVSSISQEFRLLYEPSDMLLVQAGLLYAEDEEEESGLAEIGADALAFGFLPSPPFPPNTPLFPFPPGLPIADFSGVTKTNQSAVFGEVSYRPIPQLELILGGRYTEDEVKDSRTDNPLPTNGFMTNVLTDEETFDDFSMRASAVYEVSSDVNVYASYAEGFKSGGLQLSPNPLLPQSFGNEEIKSYETGLKGRFFRGALQANASVFLIDWQDLQLNFTDTDPNSPTFAQGFIRNVSEAEIKGIEFDFRAMLTDRLSVDGAIGYLDSEFGNSPNCDTAGMNCDGTPLPLSPEWTGSWGITYSQKVFGDWDGYIRADGFFRGEQFDFINGLPVQDELIIDGYDQLNLRLGAEKDNISLALFADNIGNQRDIIGFRNPGSGYFSGNAAAFNEPQTVGFRVTLSTQ